MKKDLTILALIIVVIIVIFLLINGSKSGKNFFSYDQYNDNTSPTTSENGKVSKDEGVMGAEVEAVEQRVVVSEGKITEKNNGNSKTKKENEKTITEVVQFDENSVKYEHEEIDPKDAEAVHNLFKELMQEIKNKEVANTLIDNTNQNDYDALFYQKISSATKMPIQIENPEENGYLEFTVSNYKISDMKYLYNNWTYDYNITTGSITASSENKD